MYYQLLFINNMYLISFKMIILDMTINNPIFIFALITVIWFIPGILVDRINELKRRNKKKKIQDAAIEKLYPRSKDFKE